MTTTDSVEREFAEQHMHTILARLAGPGAVPRADQVDAVNAVLQPASRVLVVQATGWGKSAVYWAATHAIRSTDAGPKLVVYFYGSKVLIKFTVSIAKYLFYFGKVQRAVS